MQKLPYLFVFFLLSFLAKTTKAQDVSGLWKGHITTPEKDLPFEVVIAKNGNDYKAWSLITFYTGKDTVRVMKNMTVQQNGNTIVLTDGEIIEDNFKEHLPKKIKQINELVLSNNYLIGKYKTEVPRNMRSSSGSVELKKINEPLFAKADIIEKITQKNILEALNGFEEPAMVKATTTAITKSETQETAQPVLQNKPDIQVSQSEIFTEFTGLNRFEYLAVLKPVQLKQIRLPDKMARPATFIIPRAFATLLPDKKPDVAIVQAPASAQAASPKTQPKTTSAKMPDYARADHLPTAKLENRKIENIETFTINTDSLLFSLYDNGEVDGDTVTVTINGRVIFDKQGLTTTAATKTIYLTPQLGDKIELVMYAENLGAIAPNTGLLIIQDGPVRREIRFSGDLQKSAGITLLRRL